MSADARLEIHPALPEFVADCTSLLSSAFGRRLSAVYVIGSIASGDASVNTSDVDLLGVVDGAGAVAVAAAGEQLADLASRCPLRGLEAVIYRRAVLAAPQNPLPYLVNVNAGPRMKRSVSRGGDPGFWFLLDVAAARDNAITLMGPPAAEVIAPPPVSEIAAALVDSLAWHRSEMSTHPNAVLNACRAWRWCATGRWTSKGDAGRWAVDHGAPQVVRDAVALRRSAEDAALSTTAVGLFLHQVEETVKSSCLGAATAAPS